MSAASLCNRHVADIERPTTTSTAAMGQSKSWAVTYNDISCTIQPANGKIVTEFGRRGMTITHTVYTVTPLALKAEDRVVCGGITYLIRDWGDMADRAQVYRIHVERKQ